jgi:hypothetical protein
MNAVGAALLLGSAAAAAEHTVPSADESLGYTVNWPSGLSLGEGRLQARKVAAGWEFELSLDAAVPGYGVSDRYRSLANADLCSLEFHKESAHGSKKTREKTAFDYKKGVARRSTAGGGKTEIAISGCARDALAFLFYTRRELAQGRVPPPQPVFFGASYSTRQEYTGPQEVSVNERRTQADRMLVSFKGPASQASFEIFFAQNAARTPVLVRAPLALATFTMELVR